MFTAMVKWISTELGKDTVLHISRYFPNYKLTTEVTPITSIRKVQRIAENELTYVYTGNISAENNNTRCKYCKTIIITRQAYETKTEGLDEEGRCKTCGNFFHKKT
jgi:pyruvate formate lyase activating enzyme